MLYWADIVRASMQGGIFTTFVLMFKTAWIYVSTGALRGLAHLRKGPLIAALYPVLMLLVQLSIATGIAFLVATLVGGAVGVVLGLILAYGVLWGFRRIDGSLYAYYLMHDYAYSAGQRGETPTELKQRLDEFLGVIGAALQEKNDEVLVVGHSSGAHLAINVIADLIRAGAMRGDGPRLSLLTIGHVVPMISFLPDAHELRADLEYLSTCEAITWIDVSAPGDGCCFGLCDPVAVSGVATSDQKWPLVLSAAFTQTLSEEKRKELKWRFFRLHFQYLCAFDRPGIFDYFQITAGPVALADRYEGRGHSKSRIKTPLSPHTGRSE